MLPRTAASLVGLGLLWLTSSATAQQPSLPPAPEQAPAQTADGTITFTKEANTTIPVMKTSAPIPSVPETATPAKLPPPVPAASNESPAAPLPPVPPPVPAVVAPSSLPARSSVKTDQPAVVPSPSFARPTPAAPDRSAPTNAVTFSPLPATNVRFGTMPVPATRQVARQVGSGKSAPAGSAPAYTVWAKEDELEADDQSPQPGPAALFKLESEAQWMERMRQESRSKGTMERIVFPDEPPVSTEKYVGRDWKPQRLGVEPSYVCYGRLYFEDKNAERYGWDLGPLHPLLSTTKFFYDCAMLPYNAFSDPFNRVECSAGYCLPGDPVPLMLYPPKLSLTGLAGEAMVATPLVYVFP